MKNIFLFVLILSISISFCYIPKRLNNNHLCFVFPSPFISSNTPKLDCALGGRFTKELYKEIRRRIRLSTETVEQRRIRLDKEAASKRDGLLYHPKTSYQIYIAVENRPLDLIRDQFGHILHKLKKIGAEDIHIYNLGLKNLVRPIKKKYEANFLYLRLCVYPSLIDLIRFRLSSEPGVLRILILKDKELDKERRIYRDSHLYVRHPYFNTEVYQPLKDRLKRSPYV